ncbi:MAG: 3-oxoacyl-[acyl-carrier-protein] reductase FabG [Steroidobacteraceae bacterium]|nr:3-oxoacyl-[acyl-carrier-protein] reductase FabG [Steroidobacteraceae bacterium]
MPPEPVRPPVAFITGAAGGIGRALIDRLRAEHWRIYASDRALADIPCAAADFHAANLDVTDEAAIEAAVAGCVAVFGGIDHVIHLAGEVGRGPIDAVSRAEWQRLLDVNLTSAFLLARAVRAPLRASHGSLTLISSTNGRNGGSTLSGPAYAVAKAGLLNLVRYLAKEWAADRVRVNAVAPGPVDTPMMARLSDDVRARIAAAVPLGRLGEAREVAAAICYLIGRDAAWITGTVLNVSGGGVLD